MSKKYFEIIDDNNFITINLFFIKMKFDKKKYFSIKGKPVVKSQINVVEFIKKYDYVFNTPLPQVEPISGFENCIWQLWMQGVEDMPCIIKVAMDTVEKCNPNMKRIIITKDNLNQYVEIPDFIRDKYEQGIISRTHLSDYIRVCLLQKYGGTWADASCFFTSTIPSEIINTGFFQYKNPYWFMCKEVPTLPMLKSMQKVQPKLVYYHTGSSWFLHAKPNNPIISRTKQLLEEYWRNENSLIDYFLFHYFLTFAVMNDESCKNEFNSMPSYHNIYPHILQNLFDEDYDKDLWQQVKQHSFIHKLKWKGINNLPIILQNIGKE